MTHKELRETFLSYFKERDHTVVPSSSLGSDDPSVLLTTAGMQQFKPYFTGEADPEEDFSSKNTASVQKCFRTSDIDEVGDESHLTFFEMLGNFSFGGYFKKEAIEYGFNFITKELGLDIAFVTVFDPEKVADNDWRKDVPFDKASYNLWKDEIGLPEEKIHRAGVDNFWGPTGAEGPCGPTTEIYITNAQGHDIEIWNIVFNEFYADTDKNLTPLKTPGVDTGMGLERLAMVVQKTDTLFETDLFTTILSTIPSTVESQRTRRIIADHIRGSVFLIADDIRPQNTDAGYILRRLLRRVISFNIPILPVAEAVVRQYKPFYPDLNLQEVEEVVTQEEEKFKEALKKGLKELEKREEVDSQTAFDLYQTYGLPFEVIKDYKGGRYAQNLSREQFEEELEKHKEISRAGAEEKFGGHGLVLNTGELTAKDEKEKERVIRQHTATHLLQAALREILGNEVQQKGSDINAKRLRFDFSFSRGLTDEEIKQVEERVNQMVQADAPITKEEMPLEQALKSDALSFFADQYPDVVTVYTMGEFSKEVCGGPHVSSTGEVGEFRILKEKSNGAGVRRIRATVAEKQ